MADEAKKVPIGSSSRSEESLPKGNSKQGEVPNRKKSVPPFHKLGPPPSAPRMFSVTSGKTYGPGRAKTKQGYFSRRDMKE